MTRRARRARRAPLATALVGAALLTAAVAAPSGALARHAVPIVPTSGFAVVQYQAGAAPVPWSARLLSTIDPATTTAAGPRAAADADGGTQVAYRDPAGDAIWLDGGSSGFTSVDLTRLLGLAPLVSEPDPAVSPHGLDEVFCVTRSDHLLLLTWDPYRRVPSRVGGAVARQDLWTRTDLTQLGGPRVTGTPSVVVAGPLTWVFTRTVAGDLVEYANDGVHGHAWNGYDLSLVAAGPRLATDPQGFFDPATQEVRVAGTELAPHAGDVVVYTPNDVGGRVWSYTDATTATHSVPLSAGLDAVVYGGDPTLLGTSGTGDLLELTGDDAGATKTTWSSRDLTAATTGSPEVTGTPSATVSGARLAVATVAASWGDLFAWSSSAPGTGFTATDVSNLGSGSSRTVTGTPAAVFVGGQLALYAAGVSVPAPQGTGVYSVPFAKWPQALRDGWPILGVTGGLGGSCTPWTMSPTPAGTLGPDEDVGQVIQSSHQRETWLSFWTVSGPGTTPSSKCTKEKGPYTSRTYYLHGYAAGRYVATTIDAYRAQGLGLKPDWVLFDPKGFPDNHSGLWGPTAPPAKLAQSVANWYAMLDGWRNGLTSVDPALKAGVYANQYEYMAYKLFNQPLPAFVAGAFAEVTVKGQKQLQVPTRTAFGANILGFVMYNAFDPTCAQVTDERLLLSAAPWDGAYNTIQITPGKYCPPGAG